MKYLTCGCMCLLHQNPETVMLISNLINQMRSMLEKRNRSLNPHGISDPKTNKIRRKKAFQRPKPNKLGPVTPLSISMGLPLGGENICVTKPK